MRLCAALLAATAAAACAVPPTGPPVEAPYRDAGLAPRHVQVPGLSAAPPLRSTPPIEPIEEATLLLDLDTCLSLAGSTGADVERARARLEVVRQAARRSEWRLFPELSLRGGVRRETGRDVGSSGTVTERRYTVTTLGAALQYVLNPGAAVYDRAAAFLRVEEIAERTAAERFGAERAAATLYVILDLQHARAALLAELTEAARRQIDFLQQSVAAGLLSADVLAGARLLEARRQRERSEAERDARAASIRLAEQLRLDPRVTLTPAHPFLTPLALVDPDLPIDELLALAAARRPESRAAGAALQAAEAESTAAAWAAWFPTFTLSQSYGLIGRSHASDELLGTDGLGTTSTFLVGAVETLSGGRFGDLAVSRALAARAAIEPELVDERIRAEVVGARTASRDALATIERTRREVAAATHSLAAARDRQQVGFATGLEALVREEFVVEARLRETAALAAWNQAQVDLLFAVGSLGPAAPDS